MPVLTLDYFIFFTVAEKIKIIEHKKTNNNNKFIKGTSHLEVSSFPQLNIDKQSKQNSVRLAYFLVHLSPFFICKLIFPQKVC